MNLENIESFIEKYYKPNEKIILACSTWPDSMFLLYKILKTKYKNNLVVCYFNHKLRVEADKEEKWLEDLWNKEWFQVEIGEAKIREIKEKLYPSKSLEELAREKRYEFLNAILNIYNADKIITGHHLDDKIETFFFNLARWSKLTWLINMSEKSWSILRPLLNIEKTEILQYLKDNKLEYNVDLTNQDIEITRNKLRHDIIPQFEKINSKYKWNINNVIQYFSTLKDYIDDEIIHFLWEDRFFDINNFNSKQIFLQKEIIRYIYYISNWKSTIWLSEGNIKEVIRFINWKNNKTVKEIRNMKLKKDNKIIKY